MFSQHGPLHTRHSIGLFNQWPPYALSCTARMHTQIPPDVDPHKPPKAPPPSIDPDPLPDDPVGEPDEAPEGDPPARRPPLHAAAMRCVSRLRGRRAISARDRATRDARLR